MTVWDSYNRSVGDEVVKAATVGSLPETYLWCTHTHAALGWDVMGWAALW